MPALSILIKPVSSNCNMCCSYCFYADVAARRKVKSYGCMGYGTLKQIVRKTLGTATTGVSFFFQGGEPTLAGLDFYRDFMELVRMYNKKCVPVRYLIQTNGYLIDREWAEFLAKNRFLVGLSLDGMKDTHDRFRQDTLGKGTFSRAMRAAQLLNQHGVEYNILTVVTAPLARNIGKVYHFYMRNKILYQQYIPCLEPFGEERSSDYSLTAEAYGRFLVNLFNFWYLDCKAGRRVSIRYFDNLIAMLRGYPPESCDMNGYCSLQTVVEADGSVYPCDFYVLDQYRLGNFNTGSFSDFEKAVVKTDFLTVSTHLPQDCRDCRWISLCRGGCRRLREPVTNGIPSHNRLCIAYRIFFTQCYGRLVEMAQLPSYRV